ncbi:MAG TPA: RNA polymerase sigma factor SigI [Streptosporangiaceae bacterium]
MPAGSTDARIIEAYRKHRPYLVDLAFRMLGDIGAAEDTVQDAYTRLLAAGIGEIADERGWLTVVTSRLCLDRIKSARSRHESAHDATQIEFTAPAQTALANPADRVTFDDSVRLALLVVLQRLSPAERVAFVLHDIFQMPFTAVAQTVGRTAQACRQLASRARQKIAAAEGGATVEIPSAEHRLVTEKFIAACANGDLDGLLAVLAPDAWGDVDYGPGAARPHVVVTGAERVGRHLLHFWGPGTTLVSVPAGGQPATLGFTGRELAGVLVFGTQAGRIQTVHVITDPAKLRFLTLQLAGSA